MLLFVFLFLVDLFLFLSLPCLKKNQTTPRPSEHPPGMGEKMSKRLGGIKRLQIQNLFMCSFLATMSFAGYFLIRFLLFAFAAFFLRTRSRFDLVWFRLSCDHGWIRSGSVNVRSTTNNKNDSLTRCIIANHLVPCEYPLEKRKTRRRFSSLNPGGGFFPQYQACLIPYQAVYHSLPRTGRSWVAERTAIVTGFWGYVASSRAWYFFCSFSLHLPVMVCFIGGN